MPSKTALPEVITVQARRKLEAGDSLQAVQSWILTEGHHVSLSWLRALKKHTDESTAALTAARAETQAIVRRASADGVNIGELIRAQLLQHIALGNLAEVHPALLMAEERQRRLLEIQFRKLALEERRVQAYEHSQVRPASVVRGPPGAPCRLRCAPAPLSPPPPLFAGIPPLPQPPPAPRPAPLLCTHNYYSMKKGVDNTIITQRLAVPDDWQRGSRRAIAGVHNGTASTRSLALPPR